MILKFFSGIPSHLERLIIPVPEGAVVELFFPDVPGEKRCTLYNEVHTDDIC